ncbi:MAG: glucose-6-phosphate dehydrogenase [Candidatus Poribacteria bacterium]|nr:glucose-6-phosphate dehydrogenase [Candidatus Poribacteria bacterium]
MSETIQTSTARVADPCVMIIFGASGDLTKRKLVPALYNLVRHGLLSKNFAVVGFARREIDHDEFRHRMTEAIQEFGTTEFDSSLWDQLESRIYYLQGNLDSLPDYSRLAELLKQVDEECGTRGNYLYYLSTPPSFFDKISSNLGAVGLAKSEADSTWRRIIVEKPFGHDLDSAIELNHRLLTAFDEEQIYRIDHYLGKETVQNILVFRFANGIFEPIWDRRYIDHVQIMVAESIGIEGRGAYYEESGVLRDMIQNHMFQVLSLVAMEPPISFEADAVRNEKVKVLNAIRPMQPEEIIRHTVRGQYGEGLVSGDRLPGYRGEPNVSPTSTRETYAALRLFVENWRWAGVPFYLRSGKALAKRDTQVMIQFRRVPHLLFRGSAAEELEANRLIIHIQPDELITIRFQAKVPGPAVHLTPVNMEFRYKDLAESSPATGYETLLYDCMNGDSTQFHRADMVEAAWEIATPILDVWEALRPRDFPNYAAGTWGPRSADALIEGDGRSWLNPSL